MQQQNNKLVVVEVEVPGHNNRAVQQQCRHCVFHRRNTQGFRRGTRCVLLLLSFFWTELSCGLQAQETMPVTPSFTCWQDEEFVYLAVRVPWVRVGGMEFVIDQCNFSFFCKPCVFAFFLQGGARLLLAALLAVSCRAALQRIPLARA